MSARFLTAYLSTAAILAGVFTQAAAKPPELPVKLSIECEPAPAHLVTRTYSVADLVIPIESAPGCAGCPSHPECCSPAMASPVTRAGGPARPGSPAGLNETPVPAKYEPVTISGKREQVKPPPMPRPYCPGACKTKEELKDIQVHVQQTYAGDLLFGVGVNSDAGVSSGMAINERDFDTAGAEPTPMPAPAPCAAPCCTLVRTPRTQKTLEDQLIKLIVHMIKPESWDEMGGSGTIDYFPLGKALVINQTPEIQEQVAELLASLRRLQDEEVAVEMRFITVPTAFFDQVVQDLGFKLIHCEPGCCSGKCPTACQKTCSGESHCTGQAFLDDSQVAKLFEKLQADPQTNVMQAPKLTVFNGQASTLNICEEQRFVTGMDFQRMGDQVIFFPKNEPVSTGLKMMVQPVISADKRFVRLSFEASVSEVDSPVPLCPITTFIRPIHEGGAVGEPVPFTAFIQQPKVLVQGVNKTACIPDGGTLLLTAWDKCRQVPEEVEIPILSRIPYVTELFKNVRYHEETTTTVVMVTPRIICNAEREAPKAVATETTPSVIENLHKLEQARQLFKKAEHCRRHGQQEWAAHAYQQIEELCPGSRVAQMAGQCCKQLKDQHDRRKDLQQTPGPWMLRAHYQIETPDDAVPLAENNEKKLSELLDKYYQACHAGHSAEAVKWAVQALALDPACFSKEKDKHNTSPFTF